VRIYVSGPMRGYPAYNAERFAEVTAKLRELGHEVWSPSEQEVWDTEHGPSKAMNLDTAIVKDWAEGVYVLDGWDRSFGARSEVTTAEWAGVPIFNRITVGGDLVQAWPDWSGVRMSGAPTTPVRAADRARMDALLARANDPIYVEERNQLLHEKIVDGYFMEEL
jgi:hypothetical protein